jgi:hypothetical protein
MPAPGVLSVKYLMSYMSYAGGCWSGLESLLPVVAASGVAQLQLLDLVLRTRSPGATATATHGNGNGRHTGKKANY